MEEPDEDQFTEKYLHAIQLFNEQEFFECHDELEELWSESMGEQKEFLQGLIQASVALFHFGNENFGGARKLYESSRKRLERFPAEFLGIDVLRLVIELERCFEELLGAGTTYPAGIELRDELIPMIHFAGQE